ncbi:Low molecular weight protein tyrosine phosphatase [hydrothermal vent metagenome]|uniref:Low molecular weight protein tyrosine phosphatase n=1 Tax=hydrothermal vent metagenome TaxID=652676 RepID=A0A3B0RGB8_9ZZZZ
MPRSQIYDGKPTPPPANILFVCTGNTCRSPLAEVIARSMFDREPVTFSSAGTHAVPGTTATQHARTVARERSLDLSGHRARPLEQSEPLDLVLGMEEYHVDTIRRTCPNLQITRFRCLDEHSTVADPYGCDLDAYRTAADHIENALTMLLADLHEIIADTRERP